MIGRSILILAACLIWVLTVPRNASAHVLQADTEIGAILHIIPDDNPITGRDVEYTLSFQDVTGRFSLQNCDCRVSYIKDGEVVATNALDKSSPLESRNHYTFLEPAVYTLQVNGKPKSRTSFPPFMLEYSVRVSSGDIVAQGTPVTLLAGIGGIVGVLLLAAYVTDSSQAAKPKK